MTTFAGRATIGARYLTKSGWPIVIRAIGAQVTATNGLTGETHRIDKDQLLWPYNERLISKEAITMARAKGHKKHPAKKAGKSKKQVAVPAGALVREYNGKAYTVEPSNGGYLYGGETFKSLTAVAKKITGYPSISGPAFFKNAQAPAPDPSLVI